MTDYTELKRLATRIVEVQTSQDVPISKLFDEFDAATSPVVILALIAENESAHKHWQNESNNVQVLVAEVARLKAENEALRNALTGEHREAFEAYFRCCAMANGKDEAWVSKNLERAEDGTYMRAKAYDGWCYWMAAKDFAAETILKEGR